MNKYLASTIAGLLATAPMTLSMISLFQRLPKQQQYPLPPRLITSKLMERVPIEDENLSEPAMRGVTLLAHFGYGALSGAPYAALPRRLQDRPWLTGSLYGVGIWALSYLGWIPALKVLTPATQHPKQRNALMLTAHLVWGSTTAIITRSLTTKKA